MTNDKTNPAASGGLQPVSGAQLPGEAKMKPDGEFVEMQELLPVMSSFQEHLAAEQRRNRARLRNLGILFVLLFAAFLMVPVYLGRVFLEENRSHLESQKAAQLEFAESLSKVMGSLAEASRELREELVRQRESRDHGGSPIASPPPAPSVSSSYSTPVPPPIVPEAIVPPPMEVAESAIPPEPEPEPASAQPDMKEVEPVAELPEPSAEPAPVIAAPEIAAPVKPPAPPGDLEVLLKQVEQAIAEKEKQLKTRKP
jgi:hypothetical protein